MCVFKISAMFYFVLKVFILHWYIGQLMVSGLKTSGQLNIYQMCLYDEHALLIIVILYLYPLVTLYHKPRVCTLFLSLF